MDISEDKLSKQKYQIISCDHNPIINLVVEGGFNIKELPLEELL